MKRAAEDEMVGWHHQLSGHELGQTLGDGEGQGSLMCCSPWGSQRIRHDLATEQWHDYSRNFSKVYHTYVVQPPQYPLKNTGPVEAASKYGIGV